jgi:hypothetical protein
VYTERNFKTKKELKEAVARGVIVNIFGNPKGAADFTGKRQAWRGHTIPSPTLGTLRLRWSTALS